MRSWLAAACALFSCMSYAVEWPSDPLALRYIGGDRAEDYNVGHYCHMGVVYAIFSDHEVGVTSTTAVWNAEANRPYHCEEFRQERERLVAEYEKNVQAYYEENPLKDIRGNPHTR